MFTGVNDPNMQSRSKFQLDKHGPQRYNRTANPNSDGPVAQLGAHYIRIVGVVGSNPIRSTKKDTTHRVVSFLVWNSRIGFER